MDPERHHEPAEPEDHPSGTWTLLLLYLLVIAGMWGWAYYLLLSRG